MNYRKVSEHIYLENTSISEEVSSKASLFLPSSEQMEKTGVTGTTISLYY